MKHIYSAGVVLFRNKDNNIEYLLLRYLGGHWDLPKGKIETGETKEQAAVREVKEETGLAVTIVPGFETFLSYSFRDRDRQKAYKTVYFFVGEITADDQTPVTLSEEHVGYCWLDYDHALYRLTFDNAQEVLHKVHGFIHQRLMGNGN
jgi:bis(5'-nucleosidyl)-tetraphosphatase